LIYSGQSLLTKVLSISKGFSLFLYCTDHGS
jgi:hypothetical protein